MTIEFLLISGLNHILRYYFLLVWPLRERFRTRGWRMWAYLLLGFSVAAAVSFLLIQLLSNTIYARFAASCFGMLYTFFICHYMTRETAAFPLLFAVLLQGCYGDNINLIAQLIVQPFVSAELVPLVSLVASLLLTCLTLPLMMRIMRGQVHPLLDSNEQGYFWRLLWVIPASNYLVFRLAISPEYAPSGLLPSSPWVFMLLLWPVITTLIYYLVLKLMCALTSRLELTAKMEEERAMLAIQKERYQQLQANVEQARTMRHDMRHHLLALQGLLAAHAIDDANQYLTDCLAWLKEKSPSHKESTDPQ